MSEEVIQKLTKKLIEGVKIDIPVVSPAQEVSGEIVIFLRKYSTNGTIPLATFASLVTFTLSYFIGFALTNTKTGNQSIYGYIVTASILSSLLILSLILNSWYRTIAKNEKTGNELLNSDLNKDGKGEIDKIKIILDCRKGRILEYVVPVNLSQIDELRQQMRENRYRILLLSIPIVMPAVTLFVMLAANEFNIKNSYIAIPVLILFFSIILAKLSFTVSKAKANKMNDYIFPQFSNKDILLNFGGKSLKRIIINEQFKRREAERQHEKKTAVQTSEAVTQCDIDIDLDEEQEYLSLTSSSSTTTTYYDVECEGLSSNTAYSKQKIAGENTGWLDNKGKKVGEGIGETLKVPFIELVQEGNKALKAGEQAAESHDQMCKEGKQAFKKLEQAAESHDQMCKEGKQAFKKLEQAAEVVTSFLKSPNSRDNDNANSKVPLEDILPILKSKLKAKDDKNDLDDTISNLVDGKVIVTYKNGATLEFTTPAKKADAREKMSCFTELRVEGLKMTVKKDSFVFDSREL